MGKSGVAASNPGTPQSWNRYAYVQNSPLEFTDPTGMDCVYNNEDGYVEVKYGDCWSGTDNGYYIDCDGCAYNAAGATVDQATGDLYFTDANGNPIDGTLISEFADPVGTSTTVVVTPTGSWSLPPGSIWVPHPDPSPSNGSGGGYATAHAPSNNNPVPPLNGNRRPGFTTQDGKCTTGILSGPMNRDPAILACCQAHDACYTQYQCNASSFDPRGSSGPCKSICNANVEACILNAINPFKGW